MHAMDWCTTGVVVGPTMHYLHYREETNPKYKSTKYWKRKVDKMFDRDAYESDTEYTADP